MEMMPMPIRFSVLFTCLLGVSSSLLAQKHPHFDDGGALQWQTSLAAAKAAASAADKLIFVEYGRAK
jgi:hypothetical protein